MALRHLCQPQFTTCHCRQYSKNYVPLEDAARAAGRGIWNGSFELPEKWRKEHPRGGSSSAPGVTTVAAPAATTAATAAKGDPLPANGCAIKGNINAKGEKVSRRAAESIPACGNPCSCLHASLASDLGQCCNSVLTHSETKPAPHLCQRRRCTTCLAGPTTSAR